MEQVTVSTERAADPKVQHLDAATCVKSRRRFHHLRMTSPAISSITIAIKITMPAGPNE